MIVANLPYTWHLLRRVFKVGAFDEEADGSVKYHSSRSARGRRTQSDGKPQTLHGQSISGSDQTSSDLDSQALKEGTVDTTCRSGRSSPAVEKHIAPLKPAAKRTWRDRGLYGREDVEAWGSDIEEEEDLEMIDRRRRLSLAITTIPTEGHTGHEDLDLHDVGGLGDMQSPPSPVHSKSSRHRHTQSDSSGQHSPTATRPKSASGAPEIAGRSNSKKSSSGKEQPRPMYASGRSKAKMPSQAEK